MTTLRADGSAAPRFEREAAQELAAALAELAAPRGPGRRERHRRLLDRAIEQAHRALVAADPEAVLAARSTLVKASLAKADDALHGAGQLSLSAQRAPTREACDDGWRRVEAIVLGAETQARTATAIAAELENDAPDSAVARAASTAARRAEILARAARRIVDERNHAYTFHADSAFSFGEGWYLAAAGVLAGVTIQLEPDKDGTAQAERFLREAGLGDRLQTYRSRPRAMKQTTELVARAFEADPAAAQAELRAAFLGDAPIPSAVSDWVDRGLSQTTTGSKKVLLWIREGVHHSARNTDVAELLELTRRARDVGFVPIWVGDAIRGERPLDAAVDMTFFWKDPIFRGADKRRAQLQFFEHLRRRHALVGQLGVTTAGMDGPALMGLPTLYLTDAPNVRMREWVGRVPGYEEIVRDGGHLERVARTLSEWAAR